MNPELNEKQNFKQAFKKRCFYFSVSILNLSQSLREKRTNWPILDQLVRSATSIGANVVEGGSSSSKREFVNFFSIALKSSSETLYWLALLQEISRPKEAIRKAIEECTQLKKLLSTIILNTKNNSKF